MLAVSSFLLSNLGKQSKHTTGVHNLPKESFILEEFFVKPDGTNRRKFFNYHKIKKERKMYIVTVTLSSHTSTRQRRMFSSTAEPAFRRRPTSIGSDVSCAR